VLLSAQAFLEPKVCFSVCGPYMLYTCTFVINRAIHSCRNCVCVCCICGCTCVHVRVCVFVYGVCGCVWGGAWMCVVCGCVRYTCVCLWVHQMYSYMCAFLGVVSPEPAVFQGDILCTIKQQRPGTPHKPHPSHNHSAPILKPQRKPVIAAL